MSDLSTYDIAYIKAAINGWQYSVQNINDIMNHRDIDLKNKKEILFFGSLMEIYPEQVSCKIKNQYKHYINDIKDHVVKCLYVTCEDLRLECLKYIC